MIRIVAPFDIGDDRLPILELASEFKEDEFGNLIYTFRTAAGVVELSLSTLDGDVSIALTVPSQVEPIVKIDLVGCRSIGVVNDKRGQYLEFVGQHRVENFSRGHLETSAGFRVRLEPTLLVEPFFHQGTGG